MQTKLSTEKSLEIDKRFVEEKERQIAEEVQADLAVKANAVYLPSTERSEKEMLATVVSGLQSSVDAKRLNSKNGRRASYEEDDLMEYINDDEVITTIQLINTPYFTRLNYAENQNGKLKPNEIYIGKETISLKILSWKDPIAKLYYQKPFHEKMMIEGKHVELDMVRELTIRKGQLIKLHPEQRKTLKVDSQLVKKLTEKKGAEMHALIDSLQAEQYELVQLPITNPIVVQGSAGSGKSVIALHRLSYLLYNYKQLDAHKMAIIGPNKLFLNHIKNVLPELGEHQIVQTTFQQLLEESLKLKNPVQQVERLILSEVLDLSVNEGRQQALKDFEDYSTMRSLKGSLEYKSYMENYTDYIVGNLAPFLKNITHGPFMISGIEIAQFVHKAPHFGDSKEQLKHYITSTFKNYSSELHQVYEMFTKLIAQQAEKFTEFIKAQELLILTTKAIDAQKEEAKKQYDRVQRVQTNIRYFNYRQMLSVEQLEQVATIEELGARDLRLKELANEKLTATNKQLSESKQQLEQMIQTLIKEQVQLISENMKQLFVLEKKASNEIMEQIQRYCQLFSQSYKLTEINELLELPEYVGMGQLQESISELLESFSTELHDSWTNHEKLLVSQLKQQLVKEITGRVAQQVERIILSAHRDVKDMDLIIRPLYSYISIFQAEVLPEPTNIYTQIDEMYSYNVEEIYHQIVADVYKQASTLSLTIDTQLLENYPVIEKHDLAALYSIYARIMPITETPFHYAIVDEAQDYSIYEMTILNNLTEQIMLMGDLGQNITPGNELNSWYDFEQAIGKFNYYELKATFRSTKQIVDFSNSIIKAYSEGKYNLPELTFRNGEKVQTISREDRFAFTNMREQIDTFLQTSAAVARMAIIAKTVREAKLVYERLNHAAVDMQLDAQSVDAKVIITTPLLAKGLEFDEVMLFRYRSYLKTDEYDNKLAYVASSRALHKLYVYS